MVSKWDVLFVLLSVLGSVGYGSYKYNQYKTEQKKAHIAEAARTEASSEAASRSIASLGTAGAYYYQQPSNRASEQANNLNKNQGVIFHGNSYDSSPVGNNEQLQYGAGSSGHSRGNYYSNTSATSSYSRSRSVSNSYPSGNISGGNSNAGSNNSIQPSGDSSTNNFGVGGAGGALPTSSGSSAVAGGGGGGSSSSRGVASSLPPVSGFEFASSGNLNGTTAAGYSVQADLGTSFSGVKSTTTASEIVFSSAAGIFISK